MLSRTHIFSPFPPSGDVGILRVPVAGGLQWLLPPGCTGLLLFAHRDQRPRAAGIQPPGVGPGDGGPRGARHRRHQVELGLTGVVTSGGAELVFEAVERGELVEPVWGTNRHCRHQELTQEHNLDPGCSCSLRPTLGWGGICFRGRFWMCGGRFVRNLWICMGKLPHR